LRVSIEVNTYFLDKKPPPKGGGIEEGRGYSVQFIRDYSQVPPVMPRVTVLLDVTLLFGVYQNRSATDAKSSSEAATCWSGE
jgi:hypothetical protein